MLGGNDGVKGCMHFASAASNGLWCCTSAQASIDGAHSPLPISQAPVQATYLKRLKLRAWASTDSKVGIIASRTEIE